MKKTRPRASLEISNQSDSENRVSVRKTLRTHGARRHIAQAASFFVLAGALVFASVAPAFAHVDGPKASDQQLEASVEDVREAIEKSSDRDLKDKHDFKREFKEAFDRPHNHWGWNKDYWKTCRVIDKLSKLLKKLDRIRERRPSDALEELYTRIWMLRNDLLLNTPEAERCDGLKNVGTDPKVTVKESDNTHLNFRVDFALPTLTTVNAGGDLYTRVHVSGVENMVGTPGEPAIPAWRKLVALPQGAKPVLKVNRAIEGDELRLNLVPYQKQAVDQTPNEEVPNTSPNPGEDRMPPEPPQKVFADKPFEINRQTYNTDRTFPPNPCKITPMGQHRDVQIAQLECTTAQYNPVSDTYKMNRGFNVDIAFEGGDGNFVTSRTFSAFESAASMTTDAVVNKDALSRYSKFIDISALGCQGEEFLILSHGNFLEAANRLATHKRSRGMTTNVFQVGAGVASRDTAEEIDDFIEDRYDDCKVRPSYVLLLGDAEFIPTFYPAGMADNAGSDFPYSNYVQILFDAFFPDFGTGRIPVDTLNQANTVVDKIITYEATPPSHGIGSGAPFYTTAGLASQFQCCRMNPNGTPLNNQAGTDQRAFIETSEIGRQELVDRGYTVPRIYTRTVDNGGYCIQENAAGDCIMTQAAYSGSTTPRRYFNGTLLPAALGAGSGFAWNGSTADVSNAWNDGRFLFVHRDHGWPGGWGDPGFGSTEVNNLTNGDDLPVVWSINCASGMFDNETAGGTYDTTASGVYFAERALRKADGGAIGVIGDTRNSPTWANNALTRGFFDAVWPNTLPGHGSSKSFKRLGDTLNWGKIYLAGQVGVEQTAGSVTVDQMGYEYHIWHVIGDPTLAMWTKNPHKLVLTQRFAVESSRLGELVKYAHEGATITKLQVERDGTTRPIGRAVVKDGVANLDYFIQPDANLQSIYTAGYDDAVGVMLSNTSTPPTQPPSNTSN